MADRATRADRRAREETGTGNQIQALRIRFQTGGKHQTPLASRVFIGWREKIKIA